MQGKSRKPGLLNRTLLGIMYIFVYPTPNDMYYGHSSGRISVFACEANDNALASREQHERCDVDTRQYRRGQFRPLLSPIPYSR